MNSYLFMSINMTRKNQPWNPSCLWARSPHILPILLMLVAHQVVLDTVWGHHGEKIKNGSFASDLRFVHISRYPIKIPGEIVWYGHYRSPSAFKGHHIRCSFEIFLRKGGRNRRLLLASQNCYFLCRRDWFWDRSNAVRINTSFLHVPKVLDFERKLLFSALLTSDFFFQVHWHVH